MILSNFFLIREQNIELEQHQDKLKNLYFSDILKIIEKYK